MKEVKFPVFQDADGNRLIFPNLYERDDVLATSMWQKCRLVCMQLGLAQTGKFSVSLDDDGGLSFPHVVCDAHHQNFAHGGDTVWLIGGPKYDAVLVYEEEQRVISLLKPADVV